MTQTRISALFAWESIALTLICMLDMFSTLYWVHQGVATEQNPWMNYWLQQSELAFCAVKFGSFVPFLFVAAYYRASRPRMISLALRGTLLAYIGLYVSAILVQMVVK